MKKSLLVILAVILVLLASCATKKPDQGKTPEVVQTTVVEQVSSDHVLVVDDRPSEAEPVAPVVEEMIPAQQQVVADPENTVIAEPADVEVELVAPEKETTANDWDFVFTSSDKATQEPKPEAAPSSPAVKTEEKKPEQTKPVAAPSSGSSTPAAEKPAAPAEKKTSFFGNVASFISHEILFSLGLLVCLGGLVYFIIAMIKSSNIKKRRKTVDVDEADRNGKPETSADDGKKSDEKSSEPVKPVSKEAPKDFEINDEEDEFLKALLGENKK